MKTRYLVLIVVFLIIVSISIYLFTQKKPIDNTKSEVCVIRYPDPNGYLLKICEYLREHNGTIIPNKAPDNYSIKGIEDVGDYLTYDSGVQIDNKVLVVRLNCCGTGDLAYIDKKTNEVIGFSPGDF